MTPPYRQFLHYVLANDVRGPGVGDITADVAGNITSAVDLKRLTGGDPSGIDGAIDAQLDRIIVACDGDIRLALFNVTTALGRSLHQLLGPRR